MLGLLLLFAWVAELRATARWPGGAARICCAPSRSCCSACTARCPDAISIDLANAVLFTSFARDLVAARGCSTAAAPEPVYLVGGAVLWLLACRAAAFADIDRSCACCSAPASSPPTPGRRPTNSGAAATSRWCRAGPRSSCCSRMARCSCCARRSAQVLPWSPTNQVFDSVLARPCSASRRCCSPSRSPSSCWRWPRSAPNCATRPRRWSIR